MRTTSEERAQICLELLGKPGSFDAYFDFFDDLATTRSEVANATRSRNRAVPTPSATCAEVLSAAEHLKKNCEKPLSSLRSIIGTSDAPGQTDEDVRQVIALAVQGMLMVNPFAKDWHASGFALGGYKPPYWLQSDSLVDFVGKLFPRAIEAYRESASLALEEKTILRAWKLVKRLGIRFRGTQNISEHLLYDQKHNILYIFHHASYLKAHLEIYRHDPTPLDRGVKDCLPIGTLPPQLLFETLCSIQDLLFNPFDPKSAIILDGLIQKGGFDEGCKDDGYVIFKKPPDNFEYVYWAERITTLHRLVLSRPPRNRLERWFERQSTEGNALFIALAALSISILIGLASILLGALQLWVSWMAWKHPANHPDSPEQD